MGLESNYFCVSPPGSGGGGSQGPQGPQGVAGGEASFGFQNTSADLTIAPFPSTVVFFSLFVDATAGARVEVMPLAAGFSGKVVNVKKKDASVNPVTVFGNGAELIDGFQSWPLNAQGQALQMQSDGVGWQIL